MSPVDPLIAEAMRKAAVAWLAVDQRPPFAVWCTWRDDALFVVSGPGEQRAPGLAGARTATVSARGDHGGLIVSFAAAVERVEPGGAEWDVVAPALVAQRLNGAPDTADRWARDCVISRLVPVGITR